MVRLMHRGREVLSEERGAVLVITAFMFVGFLWIAALVIDIVVVNQAQIRAQATVDSAVLAAVQDFDNIPAAIAAAKEYAARNYDVTDPDWAGCVDPDPLPVPTTEGCLRGDPRLFDFRGSNLRMGNLYRKPTPGRWREPTRFDPGSVGLRSWYQDAYETLMRVRPAVAQVSG